MKATINLTLEDVFEAIKLYMADVQNVQVDSIRIELKEKCDDRPGGSTETVFDKITCDVEIGRPPERKR